MRARLYQIARGVFWLPLRGANAYFVRSDAGCTLVDAGYPGSAEVIKEAAGRLCPGDTRPTSIVLTHGHPDHAGAAAGLAQEWEAPVWIPEDELPFVNGTRLYPEPLVAWLERVLPRSVIEQLTRGSDLGDAVRGFCPETGAPGLEDWTAVRTPGHTPGHVALFRSEDRTLLAGDAVLTLAWWSRLGGGIGWLWDLLRGTPRLSGPPTIFTCDWVAAAASVATLADLRPWVLASGHGVPLAGADVARELRDFAARIVSP